MLTMKLLPAILVLGMFGGCATQRPVLSEGDYTKYAKALIDIDYCNWKGWVSPDVSASGRRFIEATVRKHTTDYVKFSSVTDYLNNTEAKPDQSYCNQMAMKIQEYNQGVAARNQNVTVEQLNNQDLINTTRMRNTYCNSTGIQTFCNTY